MCSAPQSSIVGCQPPGNQQRMRATSSAIRLASTPAANGGGSVEERWILIADTWRAATRAVRCHQRSGVRAAAASSAATRPALRMSEGARSGGSVAAYSEAERASRADCRGDGRVVCIGAPDAVAALPLESLPNPSSRGGASAGRHCTSAGLTVASDRPPGQ